MKHRHALAPFALAGLLVMALLPPIARADGLNPPPPPGTTCNTTGAGTTCRATLTTTFSFPGEFTCGSGANSFAVNEQGTTDRQVVFTYDRAGNLTKRVTRVTSLVGTFTNAVTGKSVQESGHFTITHNFLTPGDLSTDQTTFDGVFAKVVVPGRGIVLQDAGHLVFSPNGDVLREGGHHQFQNSELAGLCASLS
jgi:hypothetical protein